MISSQIIKIASNNKFEGLKKIYTHKASVKKSTCGDTIKIELVANKSKIKSMRYETDACILCEASASLLANKITNIPLKDIKKYFEGLQNIKKTKKFLFPAKLKEFNKLLNKKTLSRVNCVILPKDALLKAIKIN